MQSMSQGQCQQRLGWGRWEVFCGPDYRGPAGGSGRLAFSDSRAATFIQVHVKQPQNLGSGAQVHVLWCGTVSEIQACEVLLWNSLDTVTQDTHPSVRGGIGKGPEITGCRGLGPGGRSQ